MNEGVVDAAREGRFRRRIQEEGLFETYICPIRPTYRDIRYMYLTGVGRALPSVSSAMWMLCKVSTHLQM
jgi:hypothetical protein